MGTILIAAIVALAGVHVPAAQVTLAARRTITLDAARKVAGAAETEARRNQWAVAIAVVDEAGHLVLFQRMDDAKLVAIDIAVRKARTAAYFREPTKNLETEVAGGRVALLPIDGFMPLDGGLPLVVDGKVVGAIGVSGMTGTQDAQCAAAGVAALK
jgi:glc operon protein GlcG